MTANTLQDQLTKYLTDLHSIELQALAQLKPAPQMAAADPELAATFAGHIGETEEHERLVRDRLEAWKAVPSKAKDLAGSLTGKGFALFARLQPDTPGKLVVHAFSYEHMELAGYELLRRVAELSGDRDTEAVASRVAAQERAMAQRLGGLFDRAVEAALRELGPDGLDEQLDKYLADAHAIEAQAIRLLEKAPTLVGGGELAAAYDEHLAQTRGHQELIETRLHARGAGESKLKDAGLALGALNWGLFFKAQPDTPAKLAAFSYAFEHLEIASYELLSRVARRVRDSQTEAVAQTILMDERAAADRIRSQFEPALAASLEQAGVAGAEQAAT